MEGCDGLLAIDDHVLATLALPDAGAGGGEDGSVSGVPNRADGAAEGGDDVGTELPPRGDASANDDAAGHGTVPESGATCPIGYSENGGVCTAIDGCATDHGGCNPALPCVSTGPGTTACLKVTQLAAGDAFNCVRLSDATIRCWGLNQIYELATTGVTQSSTPLGVTTGGGAVLTNVTAVAAGAFLACALDADGVIRCWGDDTNGALGDNTETSTPIPVTAALVGTAKGMGVGHVHNCAALTSGAIACWGSNPYGQLGDGTTNSSLTPVTAVPSQALAVAAADFNTCAILSGGIVQCWGSNMYGQIGDGTTTDRFTPTTIPSSGATAIAVGPGHTCVLGSGGAVQCWGRNQVGQIGDGTTTERFTPTTVISANAVSLAVSSFDYNPAHTCVVLGSGAVQCWGSNEYGQLGDGTTTDQHAPETVIASGAAAVTCGTRHTCALMRDGTVRCWGR